MIRTQICVRKTPDANSNNNISFICMTMWRYSIASFNIKLHTNDYNAMITMVNQVSSVWFDNKLLRKSFIMTNETNLNKSEFREKFCEFINLINNSVDLTVEFFPWDWILCTMQGKMKFVFTHTRVTDRTESIVVGSLIMSFHIHLTYCGTSVRSVVEKTKSSKKERRFKIRTHAKLLQQNWNANCNTSDQGVISHSRANKKKTNFCIPMKLKVAEHSFGSFWV